MAYTAIDDAGANYSTTLYTGTGSSNAITGVGFAPNLVWLKGLLGDTDFQQFWFDPVRGATEYIRSNVSNAEATDANSLTSFDSDGFTLGTTYGVNASTKNFVTWDWKAGTTTGIDTTGSSITPSSYSFNQDAGFSIIAYTGDGATSALIPHGLGAVPAMIAVKGLTTAQDWAIYHHKMDATAPEDYYIKFNTNGVRGSATDRWNDTAPTSVLFTVGSDIGVNDAYNYIAYCWAPKQGYSKFGGYEGNANANGTVVYTGFRPAFIMTKSIDSTSDWQIFDSKRDGFNVDNYELVANDNQAQSTTDRIDILSNGFKCRTAGDPNYGETYIYMAFAESPFVNSNGAPTNAR